MTEEQAKEYVKFHASTAEYPVVTDDEVVNILNENIRAVPWVAETDYKVGDVIQPTTPNGHFYCCLRAGTSDSEEPDWSDGLDSRTDEFNGEIIWRECAIDTNGNRYRLRNAIHAVWLLKASRSANKFDTSIDSNRWNRSQIYAHCLEMAKAHSPYE